MAATPEQIEAFSRLRQTDFFNDDQVAAIDKLEKAGKLEDYIVPIMQKIKASRVDTQTEQSAQTGQVTTGQPAQTGQVTTEQPAQVMTEQEAGASDTVMNVMKGIPALETAAQIVSSTYGVPIAGVMGALGGLVAGGLKTVGVDALGDPLDFSEKVLKNVEDLLVYQPQSEGGKQLSAAAAYPFAKLEEFGEYVADPIAEKYGPEAAATVKTLIQAAPLALAPTVKGAAKGRRAIAKRINAKEKAKMVERVQPFLEEGLEFLKGEMTNKLKDQLAEKRAMESPSGEMLRGRLAQRTEQMQTGLKEATQHPGSGLQELRLEVGKLSKEALTERRDSLRQRKNDLYSDAFDSATDLKNVYVVPDIMIANAPRMAELLDIYSANKNPAQTRALQNHFYKYGLNELVPERYVKMLDKSGKIEKTPISVANFDRFRQGLNRIRKQDKDGALYEITQPIKEALDYELAEMVKAKGTENLPKEIYDQFIEARGIVSKMKTEFSPKQLTGKLTGKQQADGFTPLVEGSKVYHHIMSSSTPIEQVSNTLRVMSESGAKGKQAINTLQSAVVFDLIEASFGKEGAFNPKAFKARVKSLSPEKLDVIFKNSPTVRKKLKNYEKIADVLEKNVRNTPSWMDKMVTSFGMLNMVMHTPVIGRALSAALGIARMGKETTTTAMTTMKALNPKIPGQGGFAETWPKLHNALSKGTKASTFAGTATAQTVNEE